MTCRSAKAKDLATRLVLALVVVFLLFGPYYANLLVARNRYYSMWEQRDTLLLLSCMVVLALGCVAVGELVRWVNRPWLTRLFNHMFVLTLGAALLANLWFHMIGREGYRIGQFGMETRTLWLALVGLTAYSFGKRDFKLVQRCRQGCLLVSAIVPILVFQMFWGQTYSLGLDPFPQSARASVVRVDESGEAATPVYLFLMDAWSYDRTYQGGKLRPIFPQLAELSQQSIVFHDAHSPGPETEVSVSRLLYETDQPVTWEKNRCGFDRDGGFVPSTNLKSIFARARERGCRTFMLGFAVSYRLLLGDQVDVFRSYAWLSKHRGEHVLAEMGLHAFKAMAYWTDPWSRFLDRKYRLRVDDAQALWAFRDMRRDALNILTQQPGNTFAVLHYPFPHNPYLLNADGSYRGPDEQAWEWSNEPGYERNLAYTDRVIGEFVAALDGAGRFDDALLIFTSDHAWAQDPEWTAGRRTEPRTHVPLIIKLPHQRRPVTVSSRFENLTLGSFIEHVLQSESPDDQAEQLVRQAMASRASMDGPRHLASK